MRLVLLSASLLALLAGTVGCTSMASRPEPGSAKIGGAAVGDVVGIRWVLVSLDPAGPAVPEDVTRPVFIEFADDSRVSGFSGCNSFMGSYALQNGAFTLTGPLAGTRMACPGPAEAFDTAFRAMLASASRAQVRNMQLELVRSETVIATFRPASTRPE